MIDNSGVARNNKAVGRKRVRLRSTWEGVSSERRSGGLTCAELLCKFPGEIEGNSSEVGISQKIIQIVA